MSTRGDRADPGHVVRNPSWGERLVYLLLYRFAQLMGPAFIFAVMVLFAWRAFHGGFDRGVRSFAAELLPLLVVTYLAISPQAKQFAKQADRVPNWVTFCCMFAIGVALLQLVSFSSAAPVAELVLSGCLSVLVGGLLLSLDRDKERAYYFGFVIGLLVILVFAGLPSF
jgi:hypothetical protein